LPVNKDYAKVNYYFFNLFVGEHLQKISAYEDRHLVKLMGYCCEDHLFGVVYDLRSKDTNLNLIDKGSMDYQSK
jgi:hypothetical protein